MPCMACAQVSAQALAIVQVACEADLQALDAQMAASAKAPAQPPGAQSAAASRRATTTQAEGPGPPAEGGPAGSSGSSAASYALQAARRSEKRRIACEPQGQTEGTCLPGMTVCTDLMQMQPEHPTCFHWHRGLAAGFVRLLDFYIAEALRRMALGSLADMLHALLQVRQSRVVSQVGLQSRITYPGQLIAASHGRQRDTTAHSHQSLTSLTCRTCS